MAYRGEESAVNMNRPYSKIPKYAGPWPNLNIWFGVRRHRVYVSHGPILISFKLKVKLKIRINLEIYRYYVQWSE